MTKVDPNFRAEAVAAAEKALVDTLKAEIGAFRYLPAGLVPDSWLAGIAKRQIAAVLSLNAPTRRALLEP